MAEKIKEQGLYLDGSIRKESIKIGEAAILGMLYEVSVSPSPGLVSPYSKGAHADMDYFTFLRSTSAIAYSMYLCANIGIEYEGNDVLKKLREVGIDAEKRMLEVTEGINTQRGLLFLAGVICAGVGRCVRKNLKIDRNNIANECSLICINIVEKELKSIKNEEGLSSGERLYLKHGFMGIRGEVQRGLPTIINKGLPSLEDALNSGIDIKGALSHSLISIMTTVEDTTVLNRCGLKGLNYMKNLAVKAIELGGMKTVEGIQYINEMENSFVKKGISPGGAADLLAATVMIYKLEKEGVN